MRSGAGPNFEPLQNGWVSQWTALAKKWLHASRWTFLAQAEWLPSQLPKPYSKTSRMSGPLTHSPADILRRLLISLGHGTAPSDDGLWPIYTGTLPDSPDSAVLITDTAGTSEGRRQHDGETQEKHGIQILLRDGNRPDGFEKARAIGVALDTSIRLDTVTLANNTGTGDSTYLIYMVGTRSGPFALGQEKPGSKRYLFTINALMKLRQTS